MALIFQHPALVAQDVSEIVTDETLPAVHVAEPAGDEAQREDVEPAIELFCGPAQATSMVVPKMTVVVVEIGETVGSKISKSGQMFDLALAEPLIIEGTTVLPAGIQGQGEVIHAKKAGGSGSAGELILAATYLDFEGMQIKLRSMKLGRTGASNIGLATAVGVATGPLGFLISGKNTEVTAGTIAEAKFAQDFLVPISGDRTQDTASCLKEGMQ